MPRLAPIAIAAALVLSACGEEKRRIESPRIPFTFEVPKDFERLPVRPGSFAGTPPLVAVGPDRLNAIDVRQSAARELPLDQVERQVRASLEQLGFPDAKAEREEHAGIDMVVFELSNRVGGRATRSKLHFFAGGGRTWEIECQSTADGRDELEDACVGAVESVEF